MTQTSKYPSSESKTLASPALKIMAATQGRNLIRRTRELLKVARGAGKPNRREASKRLTRLAVETQHENMMRMVLLVLALLAGCSAEIMRSYIGRPVTDVMLDYGPPANAFDVSDEKRVFQWIKTTSVTTPVYATTTGYAYQGWVNTNTQIHGGQTNTFECVYSMYARWNDNRESWIISGFKEPDFWC